MSSSDIYNIPFLTSARPILWISWLWEDRDSGSARAGGWNGGVGGGARVMGATEGGRGNGNGREGLTLAMDVRRNDDKNSDVQGDPTPAQGKEMSFGTDVAARAADNA